MTGSKFWTKNMRKIPVDKPKIVIIMRSPQRWHRSAFTNYARADRLWTRLQSDCSPAAVTCRIYLAYTRMDHRVTRKGKKQPYDGRHTLRCAQNEFFWRILHCYHYAIYNTRFSYSARAGERNVSFDNGRAWRGAL